MCHAVFYAIYLGLAADNDEKKHDFLLRFHIFCYFFVTCCRRFPVYHFNYPLTRRMQNAMMCHAVFYAIYLGLAADNDEKKHDFLLRFHIFCYFFVTCCRRFPVYHFNYPLTRRMQNAMTKIYPKIPRDACCVAFWAGWLGWLSFFSFNY